MNSEFSFQDNPARNSLEYVLFADWIGGTIDSLIDSDWIDVFGLAKDDPQDFHSLIYSAVISANHVERALEHTSWDFRSGEECPSWTAGDRTGDLDDTNYRPDSKSDGIQPIVIRRHFDGLIEPIIEVDQEFRLFHKLIHDPGDNTLFAFDGSGDRSTIVRISASRVCVKRRALREYISMKDAHLAIFFDIVRRSPVPIREIPEQQRNFEKKSKNERWSLFLNDIRPNAEDGKVTKAHLYGKILMAPSLDAKRRFLFPPEEQNYADFIYDLDPDDVPLEISCNPNIYELSIDQSASNEAKWYSVIYFRKEVLNQYYAHPEKYEVAQSFVRCGFLWCLDIVSSTKEHIGVHVEELGLHLPFKEQLRWKSFNVPPPPISRNILTASPSLPRMPQHENLDHLFKRRYRAIVHRWREQFGWSLFLPLANQDAYRFRTLHIPLTDSQQEFDSEIGNLAHLLIESLNVLDLRKNAPSSDKKDRGISLLSYYFESRQPDQYGYHIAFLRNLQRIRSEGVAHRKSRKSYTKALEPFGSSTDSKPNIYENIIREACDFLEFVDRLIP